VFTRDEAGIWTQQAYIKASNTDAWDEFGKALAVNGELLAVGAPWEDSAAVGINGDEGNSGTDGGAVYAFSRDETGQWSQEAYIKGSNTYGGFLADDKFDPWGDAFGSSVALADNMLAVGAEEQGRNLQGGRTGAAYVFVRSESGLWSEQAYLKASNFTLPAARSSFFGASVDLDQGTLAVAAPYEGSGTTGVNGDETDESAPGAGAVYVFTADESGGWSQQAYIKASNTESEDDFGGSSSSSSASSTIALDGDILAVGANREDSGATGIDGDQASNSAGRSGAVYVFTRDGSGTWRQVAYLKASNTDQSDRFGSSVAVGPETVVAGAPSEDSNATGINGDQSDNSATGSGAVYIFE
jgi:hypothetical protein